MLNARQPDGHSLRAHLEAASRMLGRLPDELANAPELPAELGHVWRWFCDLHATRMHGQFGAYPIGYAEIGAWASLTGISLRPFEVAALRAVDEAFLISSEPKVKHGS